MSNALQKERDDPVRTIYSLSSLLSNRSFLKLWPLASQLLQTSSNSGEILDKDLGNDQTQAKNRPQA